MQLISHSECSEEVQLYNLSDLLFYSCGKEKDPKAGPEIEKKLQALLDRLVNKTEAYGGQLLHKILGRDGVLNSGTEVGKTALTKNEYRMLQAGESISKENVFVRPIREEKELSGTIYLVIDPSKWKPLSEELVQTHVDLAVQNLALSRKQAELAEYADTLHKKKQMLEQVQEYNQNLLRITAHDLSSPLNAVSGYLDLIESCLDSNKNAEKLYRYYRRIESGVNDVSDMLAQLTEVVKFKKGVRTLNRVKVDVNWIVQEVCEVLRASAAQKDVKLHVSVKKEPAYVEVDIVKFKRVIYNLVSNAIKYTCSYRHIHVRVTLKKEQVCIHIKDEGVGISDNDLDTIFKPFVRLEADDSSETSQGLGLYICSYFVELMKGQIVVDSQKGKGSMFTVMMPVVGGNPGNSSSSSQNHKVPENDMPGLSSMSQLAFKY